MRMKARNRTNEEWIELYRQQRDSGMTMKSWCEEHGVNLYTMADRVSRLRKLELIEEPRPLGGRYLKPGLSRAQKQERSEAQDWMEIVDFKQAHLSKNINVSVGDFTIAVPDEFQEATFIQVCKALMELC